MFTESDVHIAVDEAHINKSLQQNLTGTEEAVDSRRQLANAGEQIGHRFQK